MRVASLAEKLQPRDAVGGGHVPEAASRLADSVETYLGESSVERAVSYKVGRVARLVTPPLHRLPILARVHEGAVRASSADRLHCAFIPQSSVSCHLSTWWLQSKDSKPSQSILDRASRPSLTFGRHGADPARSFRPSLKPCRANFPAFSSSRSTWTKSLCVVPAFGRSQELMAACWRTGDRTREQYPSDAHFHRLQGWRKGRPSSWRRCDQAQTSDREGCSKRIKIELLAPLYSIASIAP
ncbi:hypothetical protein E5Q_03531 [Mixia osmundae IAM 14324]|uniref:Uncharacterized protein n=1 Tax=Mixia osmundae (strain CBS 9802 / IAM 14324 / JCM 22182 / KY 12970) TaxID=764103 RepID=G7E221_MIXOS|nr:hypothetical protein E5Q_03531 [Mixia osmundae IAM 14324]